MFIGEVKTYDSGMGVARPVAPGTIKNREQLQEVVGRSLEVQSNIWPVIMALRQPGVMSDPEKALLVSAINDMFDVHTKRIYVIYDRLPTVALALLVLIAMASLTVAAYNISLIGSVEPLADDRVCRYCGLVDVLHPGFRHSSHARLHLN